MLDLFTKGKYWLIACAACVVVGFGTGWHEKSLRVPALLEAQKVSDVKECEAQKQITREANDTLQNDRDRIAADATRYKRMHPVSCIIPSSKSELRASGAEYAGRDGVVTGSTDDFRDYAATCERYRSEVMTCISFLESERKHR